MKLLDEILPLPNSLKSTRNMSEKGSQEASLPQSILKQEKDPREGDSLVFSPSNTKLT